VLLTGASPRSFRGIGEGGDGVPGGPCVRGPRVLWLWLANERLRSIERLGPGRSQDRASLCGGGCSLGLDRAGGEGQLSDEFIGQVVEAVRPHRVDGQGDAWRTLADHHDQIMTWVKDDLTAVKIQELLGGARCPLRTVQRYVAEACGRTRARARPCAWPTVSPVTSSKSTSAGLGQPWPRRTRVTRAVQLVEGCSRDSAPPRPASGADLRVPHRQHIQ
jgi:hypothetical protein